MEVENLIESFSEFKDVKNIDRETMMNILEDVFKSVLAKNTMMKEILMLLLMLIKEI